MDKSLLREKMTMPNPDFCMKLMKNHSKGINSTAVYTHWHREMELLYIIEGSALIKCNDKSFIVNEKDLVVVNCNEIHFGQNLTEDFRYYCIILDPHILNSRIIDLCDSKYINPIIENRILFKNLIVNDESVQQCIESINDEYTNRQVGFELCIKASLYKLIVILMRRYINTVLTDTQVKYRTQNIDRFNRILKYIENNYTNDLTLDHMSEQAHTSKYHFCRMFKKMTGHTVTHYINSIRIQEADNLLINSDLSISEIAYCVGFHDTSYFSRIYKSIKDTSPSNRRKNIILD
ncbi:AraC family transcriptional regulator [Vallitalea sediminicola]